MATPLFDLLQNSDQLFDENKYQEALDVLRAHTVSFSFFFLIDLPTLIMINVRLASKDQSLCEIKWRQARALFQLSKRDASKKNECIREGFILAKGAVTIDDGNFSAHKWMAILLDANSELDGLKARISQLETVKMHMVRAVELNPDDPTSWHLLGNFVYYHHKLIISPRL